MLIIKQTDLLNILRHSASCLCSLFFLKFSPHVPLYCYRRVILLQIQQGDDFPTAGGKKSNPENQNQRVFGVYFCF
jgi:hypothetical protein